MQNKTQKKDFNDSTPIKLHEKKANDRDVNQANIDGKSGKLLEYPIIPVFRKTFSVSFNDKDLLKGA